NSRRAALSQQAYAIENPGGWSGYGAKLWGLSACDGPLDGTVEIAGRRREFHTYSARGASFTRVEDDGTIAPTAAAGSIVFAPEIVVPALLSMRDAYGERVFARYGFLDALNPTLKTPVAVHHGRVDPALGWFDTDYLGIDAGPIVAMIETLRSDLVWRTMRRDPYVRRGLRAAGFTGGWLDGGDATSSGAPADRSTLSETAVSAAHAGGARPPSGGGPAPRLLGAGRRREGVRERA